MFFISLAAKEMTVGLQLSLIFIAVILLIILRYLIPVLVGTKAEAWINFRLSFLSFLRYRAFSDFLFEIDEGNGVKSVQIDHLVVSRRAIFVIESKNCGGIIQGDNVARSFVQQIGDSKTMIPSPVRQNKGHIYGLKQLLKDFDIKYVSMVVFSKKAQELHIKAQCFVGYSNEMNSYIRSYKKGQPLTGKQLRQILGVLRKANIKGKKARLQHIESVKQRRVEYANKLAQMECPRCGGVITLRHGKRNDFYGCSGFPTCKFNIDVKDLEEIVARRRTE